jgi:hypothetical protein
LVKSLQHEKEVEQELSKVTIQTMARMKLKEKKKEEIAQLRYLIVLP